MLPFLPTLIFAQIIPTLPPTPVSPPLEQKQRLPLQEMPFLQELPSPRELVQLQDVRPLAGKPDDVPVFNSNSPELILTEGILLSTFPTEGKQFPQAHLNFPFQDRFDIFTHHISKAGNGDATRTLFQGILIHNPGDQPVTIDILEAATYLTRPDAIFINLPSVVENPIGTIFSGPGSRTMDDVLRGRRRWFSTLVLQPGQSEMLMNLPIPVGMVTPSSNGRSTLARLRSSGPVYVANLAMFAPLNLDNTERIPTLEEWQNLLETGNLAGPRDLVPTPLAQITGRMIYGRVAGVAQGSSWKARLTDKAGDSLSVPLPGQAFSYVLSTVLRGTLGTGQVQSARMLVRYPDTAYQAHGNYGMQYDLTLPLHNPTKRVKIVALTLQTPVKENKIQGGIRFLNPPEPQVFFRGTVRFRYTDDQGELQTRYFHLVQNRGQMGEPMVLLTMPPGDRRLVYVEFLYPPDSTPPQVLTVRTLPEGILPPSTRF